MIKHFYVMSDTHDDLEAVRRAIDFSQSQGLEHSSIIHAGDLSLRPYTRESLDNLISDGDLETFKKEKRLHNEGILQEYKRLLDDSQLPYIVIPGNYDGSLKSIFGENDLHNSAKKYGETTLVGYGGGGNLDEPWIGPGHIEPLSRIGEIELFNPEDLENLLVRENPTMAIIHNPPYGHCDDMFNGQHVGTPTSTRYSQEKNNLKLILSGHIHEAGPMGNNPNGVRGVSQIEKRGGESTLVINPGNLGRFELLDSQTLEKTRAFDYGTFARVDVDEGGNPLSVTQYSLQEKNRRIGEVKVLDKITLT